MGWRVTGDVAGFLAVAGDFVRRDPVRNTTLLTVAETLLTVAETMRARPAPRSGAAGGSPDGAPLFGWWTGGAGTVSGAFLHTPPFPVLLTDVGAQAAAGLAQTLTGRPLAGVNAPAEAAAVFAGAWRDSAGCRVEEHRRMRLYRLGELIWPGPVPAGASRVAGEPDAPLLAGWFTEFAREVQDMGGAGDAARAVRERLSYAGITLWEAGGEPVAFAGVTRQVAGMVRVAPVYTPPELRGRGYASAVTAAVSQRALKAGAADVVLYTDLANPVSNSIYQRIGYRPVEDRVVLAFTGQ